MPIIVLWKFDIILMKCVLSVEMKVYSLVHFYRDFITWLFSEFLTFGDVHVGTYRILKSEAYS